MNEQILKNDLLELANYDYLQVISWLQKKKLYDSSSESSRIGLNHFINEVLDLSNLSISTMNTLDYELRFMIDKFKNLFSKKRNYTKLVIEKKIFDYNLKINELKNREVDFINTINELNPTTDIRKFEKYSQEWADVQTKIAIMSKEVANLKKQIKIE